MGIETRKNASELHISTLKALKELFPSGRILQEYKVKNTLNGRWLFLDFYLPSFGIAIEVQGEQHFKYVDYFHDGLSNFQRQKSNDEEKKIWCYKNNVTLLQVFWNEKITPELIREKIEGRENFGDKKEKH